MSKIYIQFVFNGVLLYNSDNNVRVDYSCSECNHEERNNPRIGDQQKNEYLFIAHKLYTCLVQNK
jgi:hypothetical protein